METKEQPPELKLLANLMCQFRDIFTKITDLEILREKENSERKRMAYQIIINEDTLHLHAVRYVMEEIFIGLVLSKKITELEIIETFVLLVNFIGPKPPHEELQKLVKEFFGRHSIPCTFLNQGPSSSYAGKN